VVDAAPAGTYGGSGTKADWTEAREFARRYPTMLAGGLTAENVGAAIERVAPLGVDVASGVEQAPGRKDHARVRAFVRAGKGMEGRQ
jgi:phosphoribosylanthranilate isomerase